MEVKHNGNIFTLDKDEVIYTRNINGKWVTITMVVTNDSVADFVAKLENVTKLSDEMLKDFARMQKEHHQQEFEDY